ncbi:cationic peroxidase 1-like [Andrographis paniculata]|uniref:cationic peroxidase 1-like n=1 Tax=Andrographis paniculata TaxID=175694 RepID=UPI0021E89964|nr:cationic peroxidase 1-like [Andrographis paniculata]
MSLLTFTTLLLLSMAVIAFAQPLHPGYYDAICPQALPVVRRVVEEAVQQEKRIGASILRLHFHDCFVDGCDGSILLDSTPQFVSEKFAVPNNNSARGFDVIDRIKYEVDQACGGPVVSCADILTLAARDSVVALGGPTWEVPLGRRDSTFANITKANNDIPAPFMDVPALVASFNKQGLDLKDMVTLSGGHTLGFAQCRLFRSRIYNDTNIDSDFRSQLQAICPPTGAGTNLQPLDPTPAFFDTKYYNNIVVEKGLLHSDQALFTTQETALLVNTFSNNLDAFAKEFAKSMVKMGKIKPLTGDEGQIRCNCRKVNN